MFEDPNFNFPTSDHALPFQKKGKGCKTSANNFVENSKRITKTKQVHLVLKPKPNHISKENIKQHHLDKVRKQLKFEHLKQKDEQFMYEETAEDEEEIKRPEDETMEQPLPNQIEEENFERKTNSTNDTNQCSSQINEKYAEQMLTRFNQNEQAFSPANFLQNHKVTPFMRSKMIDWLIEVLTSYKCLDETFFLAVSLMDRYFAASTSPQEVSELHLIGVTSIFIACKYEEIYPLRLQTVYERIAHKKLSCEQIKEKELEMLESLDFNVTGPTIYDYVILLVHLNGVKQQLNEEKFLVFEKIISYISKMVIFEYEVISKQSISTIAAGILYVSFKILEQIEHNFNLNDNMQKIKGFLGLEDSELIQVATQILWLAKNFDKLFQNLGNLKKFNTELFDELQRYQNRNVEDLQA